MTSIKYEFGDCRKLMKNIKTGSIQLVVTSPPYNIQKKYGLYTDDIDIEEWKKLINEVTKEVYRVLSPNGSFFLNVSPIPHKKTKEMIPLGSICWEIIKRNNLFLRNMIVWHFNNMQNCVKRLSGRWENILWCVKDMNNYIFNLKDIKIPVITKNDKRFDASLGRNPTDVWYFDRVNNMTKRKLGIERAPCVYPIPMIERIIRMSTNKGDTVLDPFMGSGTTLVAARQLERNSIGFEIDKSYKDIIKNRLKKEALQTKLI